jgi:hypothetical protein
MSNLIELRATVAMRSEDTQIARKHRDEAAARNRTPENVRALESQSLWLAVCSERERVARAACIAASLAS